MLEQIQARVVIGEGGCWDWRGGFDHGAPILTFREGGKRVKRSVRALLTTPRPDCRPSANCGNPRCVNPEHVVWLTRRQLMLRQGPHTLAHRLAIRASKRAQAKKLDLGKAREIRARLAEGATKGDLAREYGVHRSMVRWIETGQAWAEVTPWSV